MGRPKKPAAEKPVPISIRLNRALAEQLAALRAVTGETISAQVEDGLRRHIAARKRRQREG